MVTTSKRKIKIRTENSYPMFVRNKFKLRLVLLVCTTFDKLVAYQQGGNNMPIFVPTSRALCGATRFAIARRKMNPPLFYGS